MGCYRSAFLKKIKNALRKRRRRAAQKKSKTETKGEQSESFSSA
jgi:hypothetical protein